MPFNRVYLFFDIVQCFLHKSFPSFLLFVLYSVIYMKVYFGEEDEVIAINITSST